MGYSKGLGDSIERFTEATGIKKVVEGLSQGLNIPCGCQQRKQALNQLFPFKKENHGKEKKRSRKNNRQKSYKIS